MGIGSLKELYLDELADLYDAETQRHPRALAVERFCPCAGAARRARAP